MALWNGVGSDRTLWCMEFGACLFQNHRTFLNHQVDVSSGGHLSPSSKNCSIEIGSNWHWHFFPVVFSQWEKNCPPNQSLHHWTLTFWTESHEGLLQMIFPFSNQVDIFSNRFFFQKKKRFSKNSRVFLSSTSRINFLYICTSTSPRQRHGMVQQRHVFCLASMWRIHQKRRNPWSRWTWSSVVET